MYIQTLVNAKLQIGNRGQKTDLTEISLLRRRRSAMDCRTIEVVVVVVVVVEVKSMQCFS